MKHSDNHGAKPHKIPLWLVSVLILLALFSGSSLVMSIQAQSRANAAQQQVAAYEQQLSVIAQAEAAPPSLAPTAAETPTLEPTPQPTEQAAVQQSIPTKQPAAQTPPPVQKQEITVYITKTGDCYHSGECYHLRQSKIPTTLEAAKAQDYRRCSHCNAPR